jgi:hypothetical protein
MAETYYRKVIHIRAEDSPNVRLALAQRRAGLKVTGEVILPGVLSWHDYAQRRKLWNKIRQCIGLDGRFYEGAEELLYPPLWLDRAERLADTLEGRSRQVEGVGVDPGEGSANSSITGVDRYGIVEQRYRKTPDTSEIEEDVLKFCSDHNVPPDRVCIDAGGGGKQIAHYLRRRDFDIRLISFGESLTPVLRRGKNTLGERKDMKEKKWAYLNRRAQMYGDVRNLLDPARDANEDWYVGYPGPARDAIWDLKGFAIPRHLERLREQMSPIPMLQDGEGRLRLPPKSKPREGSTEKTLIDIIGYSPDEADSFVLAVHAMLYEANLSEASMA